MNADIDFIVRMLLKEVWTRRRLVVIVYFIIAGIFGGLAWIWPQVYTSTATVIVDDKNILRPLMEGTAVTTAVADPSKMAKQIMSSRKTITEIITEGNWLDKSARAEELEQAIEKIRERTEITSQGKNILEISYRDKDPERAYLTAKKMTNIFIRDSQLAKQKQSRDAFEFIDSQATVYHEKLRHAEQAIKEFQEKNLDSTPGAKTLANERVLTLKRQMEELDIEISGVESKLKAQKSQLSGEGGTENSASIEREGLLRVRVAALKTQLEDFRLIYQDTYPDIVQIIAQIKAVEDDINNEIISRNSPNKTRKLEALTDSPMALELRSQILKSKTDISTLGSKRGQFIRLLENERLKINRINMVEAEISELNRDYEVNKAKYNELIEQRENARISMNIDIANQGRTTRIEEKASLPANPKGLRFIHFILAGLVLSIAVPLGLVYGLALLDQKIRDQRAIADTLKLPVLATIRPVIVGTGFRQKFVKVATLFFVLLTSWSLFGYEIWLHMQG